ncbi:hypothetical protein WKH57_15375 [Niallia taxi]|uniref:hypothetical protein n=1 Tax=Niallia taxi TaxID=2499688 RepID=UPI00317F44D5
MHVRVDSTKPTTTISWNPKVLSKVEDYRFNNRKDNRSIAVEELVRYGLKYLELVERKKQRDLGRMQG